MIVVAIIGILAAIAIPNFLRYQLRAKFSELKENVNAVFKAEEALRQGERTGGQYLGLGKVPVSCSAGTSKVSWLNTDVARAAKIDWAVEGSTYGCYEVGAVAFADDSRGVHLTVQAQSDIDGDGNQACVFLYKPTLGSNGDPATTGTRLNSTCANAPAFPATMAAAAAATPPVSFGTPVVVNENIF
jgi:type IV pilus assembly protein PilA